MTNEQQTAMMGNTFEELEQMVIGDEYNMTAMSILSDVQEGMANGFMDQEQVRTALNAAKYYISQAKRIQVSQAITINGLTA